MKDAIILTLSQRIIKERPGGFRQILKEWSEANGEPYTWSYRVKSVPKQDITTVFWVIGGRIRYKSKVLDKHRNQTIQFVNRPITMTGNWVEMFDFEPIPKNKQQSYQGFQGFRYTDSEAY